jgi:hypothetical protein
LEAGVLTDRAAEALLSLLAFPLGEATTDAGVRLRAFDCGIGGASSGDALGVKAHAMAASTAAACADSWRSVSRAAASNTSGVWGLTPVEASDASTERAPEVATTGGVVEVELAAGGV